MIVTYQVPETRDMPNKSPVALSPKTVVPGLKLFQFVEEALYVGPERYCTPDTALGPTWNCSKLRTPFALEEAEKPSVSNVLLTEPVTVPTTSEPTCWNLTVANCEEDQTERSMHRKMR